jgi:hypothetical protein
MAYRIIVKTGIEIAARDKYQSWYDEAMAELEAI